MSASWKSGSTTAWRKMRTYVLARDKYQCQIGAPGCTHRADQSGRHAGHVDHIIGKDEGGTDQETNLRASCRNCNLSRKRKTPQYEPPTKQISKW